MAELAALLGWVAAGSALGGVARFFVSGVVARAVGEVFPWGTMVVNATGALGIGVLFVLTRSHAAFMAPEVWQVGATGFLGSYTTVSSFSLQTLALVRDGESGRAAGNVALSVSACLAGVSAGALGAAAVLSGGLP